MLTDEEHLILINFLFYGNVIVNWVSIIAASFVVAVIVSAMVIDKKTMNRVSIRITLAIAILDVVRSGFNLLTLDLELEGGACVIQELLFNFMTLGYFFLNMSIATNLQLIFLNGYSFNPFWERGYWIVSFGLAALISLSIPGGYLAGIEGSSKCLPGDALVQHVWEWSYCFLWILVSVVYCSVVVALVITKLVRNEKNLSRALSKNTKGGDWQATRYNSIIKSLLYRISFYCAIPVITHLFVIVQEIDAATHEYPKLLLLVIRVITSGAPGILNFLAFIADPAFRQALVAFKAYHESLSFLWPLNKSNERVTTETVRIPDPPVAMNVAPQDANHTQHAQTTSERFVLSPSETSLPHSHHSMASEEQQFEDYVKTL